ncbi:MAG: PorT family protein [Candidatus Competibacteraceae bacterium]|nr:PorT family protein [Candidatus Competibacteraceae bacterium]
MKPFLLFLFTICLSFVSYTQTPVRMTFRAGMNFAQISGVGMQGFNKFGAIGGLGVSWRFKPRFSFEPEIVYSMKGARRNPDPDNGDYSSYTIETDYIEIPAMFSWHIDKKDRFTLDFGATFGFLIRQRVTQNGGELTQGRGFQIFELGLAIGAAYHINHNWAFQFRFQNSIIPIKPYASGQTAILPLWGIIRIGEVHSVISLSLQYAFRLQKPLPKDQRPVKEKKTKERKIKSDVIDEDD